MCLTTNRGGPSLLGALGEQPLQSIITDTESFFEYIIQKFKI